MSDSFGDFMISETVKRGAELNELREALAASQRREQDAIESFNGQAQVSKDFMEQNRQLRSRLAAAEALIPKWRARWEADTRRVDADVCADELKAALSANGEAAG